MSQLKIGDKIYHERYGTGTILRFNKEATSILVRFDNFFHGHSGISLGYRYNQFGVEIGTIEQNINTNHYFINLNDPRLSYNKRTFEFC